VSADGVKELAKSQLPSAALDADLPKIVAAWPSLPELIKRAMLALIS
jgi:hypothetical protein